jgi:hypothetical protein
MGHGYGLQHAWDTAMNHWCGSSNPAGYGEYCDYWDAMGAPANGGVAFENIHFGAQGLSGPGLNAQHLESLGWIPLNQRFVYGVGQTSSATITLAAVGHQEIPTSKLNPTFFDVGIEAWDPTNLYTPRGYTVEFRSNTNWDRSMPAAVQIHAGWSPNGFDQTYIVDNNGGPLFYAGDTFNDVTNNVTITINSINPATKEATITLSRLLSSGGGGGTGGGGGGGVYPPGGKPHYPCTTCMQ